MRNDFLEHRAFKYVGKVKLPTGKFLYFYDMKTYQNYLHRQSKTQQGQNAKADPKEEAKKIISKTTSNTQVDSLVKEKSASKSGTTLQQKTQQMQNNIAKGTEIVKGLLAENYLPSKEETAKTTETKTETKSATETTDKTAKTTGGKSSSKKSGSSKKGSSGSSKGSKGSSGSKSSGSSKEKSASKGSSAKASSEKKEKETKKEKKTGYEESLKKMLGIKDHEVNEHASANKFLKQLGSYKDGSHGYATVGGKTYRWTKEHGKIILIDVDTNKEVSPSSLKGAIREFRVKTKRR